MTDVCYFILTGLVFYILQNCRDIVLTHFRPAELPISHVNIWVVVLMAPTVPVAPEISKPDIVSLVYSDKCWSLRRLIKYPIVWAAEDAVLEIDWLFVFSLLAWCTFWGMSRYPMNCKEVSIRSWYQICWVDISIFVTDLIERESHIFRRRPKNSKSFASYQKSARV